jgi:hypothetical protein
VWIELQRLVFGSLVRKKSRLQPGLFCAFWGVFEGVLEKARFLGGVFVVKSWWIGGELWPVDDRFVVG